jgi:hypothetical protein
MKALKKVFLTIIGVIAVGVVLIETQTKAETVRNHECTTSYWDGSDVCIDYSVIESPILGFRDSGKVVVSVNNDSAKFYFWCEYGTGMTDSRQFVGGKEVSFEEFSSSMSWTTEIAGEFYELIENTACY